MRFTRWDQVANEDATNALVTELALRHISSVEHAAGHEVAALIQRRDFRALCSYELRYTDLSLEDSRNLRQALAFFQKRSDVKIPGVDKRAVALSKFLEAEALCKETNTLLKCVRSGGAQLLPRVEAVLYHARRKISDILGRVPSYSELKVRFGPGATTQLRKREASPRSKLGQTFTCSEELLPVARCCLQELQGWSTYADRDPASMAVELHHGRLSFVPKNAKTDRTVLVEPALNTMFQLGIGEYMARRLQRSGIDITDQTRNQRLAKVGSSTGALATLDLSSASDTVARELVYDLLPLDWAHMLSRFRTGTVKLPNGSLLRQEKFSSMGNGFTFPLETLIFYGLAYGSCVESCENTLDERSDFVHFLTVYGDDIIVPTEAYEVLTQTLLVCGFLPNREKSFSSGPFRESCGKDYFLGTDIRPFYLKGPLSGEAAFTLHNYYVRTGRLDFANHVLGWIDASLHLFGPDGYGDGHLLGEHRRVTKPSQVSRGYGGYLFDTFTWKPRKSFRVYKHERVLPSYTVYASPPASQLWVARRSVYLGRVRRRTFDLSPGGASFGYERGELWHTVPQTSGYKRISVYTLG